jgi:hypothetical protein
MDRFLASRRYGLAAVLTVGVWTTVVVAGCASKSEGGGDVQAGADGGLAAGGAVTGTGAGSGGTPGTAKVELDGGTLPSDKPKGTVPMFVAAGQGGRTIVSCDDGQTWVANRSFENNNDDHSPNTHKGLAYGGGTFIVLLGWGADSSLLVSTDGVTWNRNTGLGKVSYGGIAHGGNRFVLLRQEVSQYSEDKGATWMRARIQPSNDHREGGGGDGLPGQKGVFGGGGSGTVPSMSWDGGETFSLAQGCGNFDFGGIGGEGGVAAGNGHLVFVSRLGNTCHVTDNGKTVTTGKLDSEIDGKLDFAAGKFWVTNGSAIYSSETGENWKRTTASPSNVSLQAIAVGDTGTFVAISKTGADFYRSTDGSNWQKASGPSGPALMRVVFGYGLPSNVCPGN